jgi:hypothetical protein
VGASYIFTRQSEGSDTSLMTEKAMFSEFLRRKLLEIGHFGD